MKRTQISLNKDKFRGLTLPDFKAHYKFTAIKIVQYAIKVNNLINGKEQSSKIDTHIWTAGFNKGTNATLCK